MPFSLSSFPTCGPRNKISSLLTCKHMLSRGKRTLEAGFFEPALLAGFLAVVDGGLIDVREAGFVEAAREAGLTEPAREALDAGLAAAALEAGLEAALDAGLAYTTKE